MKRRASIAFAAALGVAAFALTGGWPARSLLAGRAPATAGQPRSAVIYPPQSLPLRFSHAVHLGPVGMQCRDCHPAARTSRSAVDNLLPTEAACRQCHPIDRAVPDKHVSGKPAARCAACHPGYRPGGAVPRVRIPAANLKFSHQLHTGKGVSCQACHGDLRGREVGLATRAQLPKMLDCLGCHRRSARRELRACTTCHLAGAGNRVQTRFPSGSLAPSGILRGDAHDLEFRQNHNLVAQNDAEYCESCHTKSFCTSCHNGVAKPMDFHVGDYISMHSIDARRDDKQCQSCHRLQTFCTGCHARAGLTTDARSSEYRTRLDNPSGSNRYHPPGWVEYGATGPARQRSASHHAFEAQRNIKSCASCHREEFCLSCHSRQADSFSINPHPRGWARSWRCRSLRKRAGRMCLRCHIDASELTCSP